MTDEARDWMITAVTPIWTGDASGSNSRVIPTGLLGSIRWWFEVVIRGLGGSACDPSDETRCEKRRRCVVCELFGYTGWARKFRFQVLDQTGGALSSGIARDTRFILRLIPLRIVLPEEWALIDLTLRVIANYGALGGKTVYKPSDEEKRQNAPHHRNYGLIKIMEAPTIVAQTLDQFKAHVSGSRWRTVHHGGADWASLKHFWCVNGYYLARQKREKSTFNYVIGRPEPKGEADQNNSWLAGRRAGQGGPESKKVFSFKDPSRTFGFMKPGGPPFDKLLEKLRAAWPDLKDNKEVVTGDEILATVLGKESQT